MIRSIGRVLTLLCAVLAFSGNAAFANCEGRLQHLYTKISAKLLNDGVLSASEISYAAESDQPVNPFEFRTPGSLTLSAAQFYKYQVAQKSTAEAWPSIRAELREILQSKGAANFIVSEARTETELIVAAKEEKIADAVNANLVGFWAARNGRVFYAFRNGKNVEVRELGREDWVWKSADIEPSWKAMGLSEDADGNLLFNVVRGIKKSRFNFWRPGEYKFEQITWNVNTGGTHSRTFYLTLPGESMHYAGSSDGADVLITSDFEKTYGLITYLAKKTVTLHKNNWWANYVDLTPTGKLLLPPKQKYEEIRDEYLALVDNKIVDLTRLDAFDGKNPNLDFTFLRDGSLVGAATHIRVEDPKRILLLRGSLPSFITASAEAKYAKVYESRAGRILIAVALRSEAGKGESVEIYDPDFSLSQPIEHLNLDPGAFAAPHGIHFFEFEQRIFVAMLDTTSRAYIFELTKGPSPLVTFPIVGASQFEILSGARQVYMTYLDPRNDRKRVLSLFHRPRE